MDHISTILYIRTQFSEDDVACCDSSVCCWCVGVWIGFAAKERNRIRVAGGVPTMGAPMSKSVHEF
jgi:hypothetical protein